MALRDGTAARAAPPVPPTNTPVPPAPVPPTQPPVPQPPQPAQPTPTLNPVVPGSISGSVAPLIGPAGTIFTFSISGFQPGEQISSWVTDPNLAVTTPPFNLAFTADGQGNATGLQLNSTGYISGVWAITFQGLRSNHQSILYFRVGPQPPPPPPPGAPTATTQPVPPPPPRSGHPGAGDPGAAAPAAPAGAGDGQPR